MSSSLPRAPVVLNRPAPARFPPRGGGNAAAVAAFEPGRVSKLEVGVRATRTRAFRWPPEKAAVRARAVRLEWVTIGALLSSAIVLFLVAGTSQAMRTAFVEDLISIVPAAAFLVATHIEKRPPNARFPFGYFRSVSIAYLVAATATLFLGGFLLIDNLIVLFTGDHAELGTVQVFGATLSEAWPMLGAILFSTTPAVILGRLKLPLAHAIHDKVLIADATMQKADWMTGVAAMVGVGGILIGWAWVDAAAALAISLAVLHDGFTHMRRSVRDLADERPTTIEGHRPDQAVADVRKAVEALDFVAAADVRFREDGRLMTGAIVVTGRAGADMPADFAGLVRGAAEGANWRVHDPDVMLIAPGREASPARRRTRPRAPRSRRPKAGPQSPS